MGSKRRENVCLRFRVDFKEKMVFEVVLEK